MAKQYPDGAIKSFEELCKIAYGNVYSASKKFKIVREYMTLSITLAHMRDHNIPENQYNDWFMFANEKDAEAYAEKVAAIKQPLIHLED